MSQALYKKFVSWPIEGVRAWTRELTKLLATIEVPVRRLIRNIGSTTTQRNFIDGDYVRVQEMGR